MPSITMTDCPDCGCGGSNYCVAFVTVRGADYSQFQGEERTEWAGVGPLNEFDVGSYVYEVDGDGFYGYVTELHTYNCYQNYAEAYSFWDSQSPHLWFD